MRRVRDALYSANPHCHWCQVLTTQPTAGNLDPNAATVDHIKPRRECKSQEQYEADENHVLACFECNAQRDAVDLALLSHQRKQQAFLDRLKASKRTVRVKTRYLG